MLTALVVTLALLAPLRHVTREGNPDRLFVEEAVIAVLGDVTALAYAREGRAPVRVRRTRRDRDASEAAKDVIAKWKHRCFIALERLAEPDVDLIAVALDLGFSSHSHFTETFGRSFCRTPSGVRRAIQGRPSLG